MDQLNKQYPFRCTMSFRPMIDFLLRSFARGGEAGGRSQQELEDILEQAPELAEPVREQAVLKRRAPFVERLMALAFPAPYWDSEPIAAVVPFVMRPVFASPLFKRFFLNEDGAFSGRRNVSEQDFERGRVIRAYLIVLDKLYDVRQRFEFPLIHIVPDPDTGLERHFRMDFDFRFVEIRRAGSESPELGDNERDEILSHLTEPERLRELLPPEQFEFLGFTLFRAVDVTQTEMFSALERSLVDQESVVSSEGFLQLQEHLRVLFRRTDLMAGLAALHEDQVLLLNTGGDLGESCIFHDSRHIPAAEFEGSAYERAVTSGKVLRISDLLEEPWPEHIRRDILARGARSMILVPLFFKGECIGTLDLESPEPGGFEAMDELVAEQIRPLFAMAIKRALDDLRVRIEGVIKQECTAIHPTVEWRFRKAALQYLDRIRMGRAAELEPIVFPDVYPFYATSDIRGSADARNQAVQEDLVHQLDLALKVLRAAQTERPLFILKETAGRVQATRERILEGLGSGDEIAVLKFLRDDVVPLFEPLSSMAPSLTEAVHAYHQDVDDKVGAVYRLRRAFEESVTLLNDRLAAYLDREESEAQAMFPHYFERHRTDGLDYVIYMGKSLSEENGFCELFLRNMRLWQLRVACGMAWHTERLKASLKVPLDTAHLILVQNAPLSIRFRYDEKRFDVDGAYDVRHEILKSRIDKAVIKGSNERLTQPGKLAVVYSQPDEARDMERHIDFMQGEGFLTGETERVDLGDLPGVQGLRAFRVAVDLDSPALAEAAGRGFE